MTGDEMRAWRFGRNLRQQDLATLLDVTRQTIAGWEATPHAIPTLVSLAIQTLDREIATSPGAAPLPQSPGPRVRLRA